MRRSASGPSLSGKQEEKWRFQAEILRAECNFLRMEREVALRKLDRHRGQMEAALKSAVETLGRGRGGGGGERLGIGAAAVARKEVKKKNGGAHRCQPK